MSLTLWKPSRRSAVSNLFNSSLFGSSLLSSDIDSMFEDFCATSSKESFVPVIDINESEKDYLIEAELPGLTKADVKVEMIDGILTISGEKKFEKDENKDGCCHVERRYGSFTRSFTLPEGVESEKIKANFSNGVLTLNVPKSEVKKIEPKRIEIK